MKVSKAAILLLCLSGTGPAVADPLRVEEVAAGIFVHAGLPEYAGRSNGGDVANMAFVVGTQAVAVIDTGNTPALGRDLREAIRQRTDLPIRYVINTHMHPDHVFGNGAFLDDRPDFVAHADFQGALMARADTYQRRLEEEFGAEEAVRAVLVPPTVTVESTHRIDLGGRTLELTAHPTAHTNNDLTVFDGATGTLFAGDLVFQERLPTVDGSGLGWLRVIDALVQVPARRVVPGHGPASASWPEGAEDTRRYLTTLVGDIRAIQKDGGTIDRASADAAASERGRWSLFDEDNPRNAVTVFAELEWE
ncbi:quinoprotein relay system zinc metallohydrolase 2 [Skermanella rosea]|uniref:quinoprotein relay system zinc metallohydrolase 2 n=1 Tax=Skermanella rosea TaxID=1817965 RepID=UPI0019315270|nr:quinoprotein relay system zinc metallohydrolase 2 [Skermanella rosea]UEM02282.1 quinoprotein relay system zinc metallohydrolase 2 [Skermanella rosea]